MFGGCQRKPAKEGDFSVKDVHNPQTAEGMSAKDAEKLPVIEFETKTYDFGDVIEGERLTYSFKFKNTGKSNLIIYSSEATCGCTTSQPPKAPIRPGESDEIVVTFDSQGQKGMPLSVTEGGVMCSCVGYQKEFCFFSELRATGEGMGQKNDLI